MSAYLDASVLVALFTPDALSTRADANLRSALASPVVNDFAAAEFSSAVGRKVRTRELSETDARRVFSEFDNWLARVEARPEIRAIDVAAATAFLRRLDLNLRAPDALNIAVARRLELPIASFDDRMLAASKRLGVATLEF